VSDVTNDPAVRAELEIARVEGDKTLDALLVLGKSAPDRETATIIADMHEAVQNLYENLMSDPRDLSIVRSFRAHIVERTVDALRDLVTMTTNDATANAASITMTKKAIAVTQEACIKLLADCKANDTASAEVRAEVLRQSVAVRFGPSLPSSPRST